MAALADPFSASWRWQTALPAWEKGSKVSLSSEEGGCCDQASGLYWDSSDVNTYATSSDEEEEDEAKEGQQPGRDNLGTRPRAGRRGQGTPSSSSAEKTKGKGKGKCDHDNDDDILRTPTAGTTNGSPSTARHFKGRTLSPSKAATKPRHRSTSISLSSLGDSTSPIPYTKNRNEPGPAARAFAKHVTYSSTLSQRALPGSHLGTHAGSVNFAPTSCARPGQTQRHSNRTLGRARSTPQAVLGQPPIIDTGHSAVEQVVQRAFDSRDGNVELSGCSLVTLPPCIGELGMIVSLDPKTGESAPTAIMLYLANNSLSSNGLHPNLFSLQNLTVLSLRNNRLKSVPAVIGELRGLKELNLATNCLEYLPAELLQLKLTSLSLVSNPFRKYRVPQQGTPASPIDEAASSAKHSGGPLRVCSPRQRNFQVPSLVELATRVLLSTTARPSSTASSASTHSVRRVFHQFKDALLSPRTDVTPLPPHLLRPFLPLVQPLPHHLRHLVAQDGQRSRSTASVTGTAAQAFSSDEVSTFLQRCSNPRCHNWCHEFAEYRLEYRYEIADQKLADPGDLDQLIPVLWRGCSANCLDFLDERE